MTPGQLQWHIPAVPRIRHSGQDGGRALLGVSVSPELFLPAASEGVADFREVFCNHLLQSVTATNGPGFEELTGGKAAC